MTHLIVLVNDVGSRFGAQLARSAFELTRSRWDATRIASPGIKNRTTGDHDVFSPCNQVGTDIALPP